MLTTETSVHFIKVAISSTYEHAWDTEDVYAAAVKLIHN